MLDSYTYVDGSSLVGLILEVRDEFLARSPFDGRAGRRPNSVQAVAIDIYGGKQVDARLEVLRDLMERNGDLVLDRVADEMFVYSDTAPTYLTDLVCAVVGQVLLRDPTISTEDARRIALAGEGS
jgi:hypothetical protein